MCAAAGPTQPQPQRATRTSRWQAGWAIEACREACKSNTEQHAALQVARRCDSLEELLAQARSLSLSLGQRRHTSLEESSVMVELCDSGSDFNGGIVGCDSGSDFHSGIVGVGGIAQGE